MTAADLSISAFKDDSAPLLTMVPGFGSSVVRPVYDSSQEQQGPDDWARSSIAGRETILAGLQYGSRTAQHHDIP